MNIGSIKNLTKKEIQDFHIKVGKNVAKFRKEKKLSQLELSLLLGYKSPSQVASSEICYKNYHFNIEQLLKLSIIFQVDICEFF